jgi:hypothetical protein
MSDVVMFRQAPEYAESFCIRCLTKWNTHDSQRAVSLVSPSFSGSNGCTLWRLGPVAKKPDFKTRLPVRDWVEQYCQIPRLAMAIQIRSGHEHSGFSMLGVRWLAAWREMAELPGGGYGGSLSCSSHCYGSQLAAGSTSTAIQAAN